MHIIRLADREGDAEAVNEIARQSPPLLAHGPYVYWMMFACHPSFSVLAELDGKPVGFIMGVPSEESDLGLFIWQVGVLPSARRRGIGQAMALALLDRHPEIRRISAATADSNDPIRGLLGLLESRLGATFTHNQAAEARLPLGQLRHYGERLWTLERPQT